MSLAHRDSLNVGVDGKLGLRTLWPYGTSNHVKRFFVFTTLNTFRVFLKLVHLCTRRA